MTNTKRTRSHFHRAQPRNSRNATARGPAYDRRTELPRILPLWPRELDDQSAAGRRRIVAKLARALRAERRRGVAGHWTYDLARHVELLRVYRLELAAVPRIRTADSARVFDTEHVDRCDDEANRHSHGNRYHNERK